MYVGKLAHFVVAARDERGGLFVALGEVKNDGTATPPEVSRIANA